MKFKHDDLSTRMKEYEAVTQGRLVRRMPAIVRVDGKAFHNLTHGMEKPYDSRFFSCMSNTALSLFCESQTAAFAYFQSDEVSVLLKDYTNLDTQAWYNGNIQKIVGESASIASVFFNELLRDTFDLKFTAFARFDARVFNIPKEDVANYFVWRQNDASRNSIQGLGQANFTYDELHGKSNTDVLDMLIEKGINWNQVMTHFKRGACIYKDDLGVKVDLGIPIFTEDRNFIERFI